MQRFTVGLIQMAPEKTKAASIAKASSMVERAARDGARLVCLPELFATAYFCQTEDHAHFELAEGLSGPTVEAMSETARKAKVTLVAPIFERRAPGVYHNSQAVIGPDGQVIGVYRKMHIPDDPGFYEKFYFAPGDLGFSSFETPVGPVGTLICWDQWFPEAARLTAMSGALILFYPTAIGWQPAEKDEFGAEQREAWMTIQRSHAIANGVFVAAVNRVGTEKAGDGSEIEFWGSSFLAGPFGKIIAQASTDKEEIVLAEVDPAECERTRQIWPFLRDRRIDAYEGLCRRFLK